MKRCSSCRRVLPDDAMVLCPYDGTPLLDTMVSPTALADTVGTEAANEESKSDPMLEKAAKIARQLTYRQRLSSLLDSEEGLRLADAEMQSLFSYVKEKVGRIHQAHPELGIQFGQNDKNEGTVYNQRYVVIMSWQTRFVNTLSDSSLQIVERKRSEPYPKESDELNRVGFGFYMNSELQLGWKEESTDRFLTTPNLGQECVDRLLNLILTTKE